MAGPTGATLLLISDGRAKAGIDPDPGLRVAAPGSSTRRHVGLARCGLASQSTDGNRVRRRPDLRQAACMTG